EPVRAGSQFKEAFDATSDHRSDSVIRRRRRLLRLFALGNRRRPRSGGHGAADRVGAVSARRVTLKRRVWPASRVRLAMRRLSGGTPALDILLVKNCDKGDDHEAKHKR